MSSNNFNNVQARPFTFSYEVQRSKRRQQNRDLVFVSAATLFSVYAVGIALVTSI